MECPGCGSEVHPEAKECPECGLNLAPTEALPLRLSAGAVLVPEGESVSLPLQPFPIWLLILLHYMTLGLFSLVLVSMYHGDLPRRRPDDPSAARAFWFLLIPVYCYYWFFFSHLRLCERLNEERAKWGLPPDAPRRLAILACISVLPVLRQLLWYPILYPLFAGVLQAKVNQLAEALRAAPESAEGRLRQA